MYGKTFTGHRGNQVSPLFRGRWGTRPPFSNGVWHWEDLHLCADHLPYRGVHKHLHVDNLLIYAHVVFFVFSLYSPPSFSSESLHHEVPYAINSSKPRRFGQAPRQKRWAAEMIWIRYGQTLWDLISFINAVDYCPYLVWWSISIYYFF